MLYSLEMHAQEMANLLESLVEHFDLCVMAVKHTEGGGAAAQSITGDMPTGVPVREGLNANLNVPMDPLSESHYREMVNVLIKDAAEAEDVVMEIQDRIGDMESVLENLLAQRDVLLAVYQATTNVYEHLSSLASSRLPSYIAQAHNFTHVWNDENERINGGLADLSDLHSLYDGFLDAYDGLLLEVARRKHVRARVEKVIRETQHKLDHLYEEDVNARETFRVEQGDYLPSDIWPGLSREPMHVEFRRISGGNLKDAFHDQEGLARTRLRKGRSLRREMMQMGKLSLISRDQSLNRLLCGLRRERSISLRPYDGRSDIIYPTTLSTTALYRSGSHDELNGHSPHRTSILTGNSRYHPQTHTLRRAASCQQM